MSTLSPVFAREDAVLRCPYPLYDEQRADAPVFFDQEAGFWVITGFAEAEFAATNPDIFSSENPGGPTIRATAGAVQEVLAENPALAKRVAAMSGDRGAVLFTSDPPYHSRHRRLLNKALTPRTVSQLEPALRTICHDAIDKFIERGTCDFVPDFSDVVPAQAQAILLGVPAPVSDSFVAWGKAINSSIGGKLDTDQVRQLIGDQNAFFAYFDDALAQRRVQPTDDLLSAIANAQYGDDEPFTDKEVVGIAAQLVGAGSDTTTSALSNAMHLMLNDPELHQSLRDDYSLLPDFFEEALRVQPPVQGLFRRVMADVVVGGQPIKKGDEVWISWAAANYDDTVFECPAHFDASRENLRSHMSFGRGNHFCIGASLARLMLRVCFETLLDRLHDLRLDETKPTQMTPSYVIHGFQSLPLAFAPSTLATSATLETA